MTQVADVVQSGPGRSEDPATDLDATQLAQIVKRAGSGDEKAWRELIDLYSRRVFAMAKSRCSDPALAEEITQSVFATIATKLAAGQYNEQGRFESWLFRVTMNRVRDEARRMKRHAQPTDPVEFGTVEGKTEQATGTDAIRLDQLRTAMNSLSDSDREVIELRHHGAMSFKQMSAMLDEPVGTLLARHHRALRKLKAIIEGYAEGQEDEKPNQESRGSDR
jgi:RNA polymerase sigma-70 factor, ECF subfamily